MGPWDMIALIHGIEHFYSWEAPELLRQCWEILTPGGQLILVSTPTEGLNAFSDMWETGNPEAPDRQPDRMRFA